jgi:hypothetical protein
MSILRLSLGLALLGSGLVQAEDKTAQPESTPGKYQLKNRSVIAMRDTTRPPFWPIGWVKRGPNSQKAPIVSRVNFDEKSFVVSSILLGNPSLAVINGRSYSEGDFLRFPRGTVDPVRIRVKQILDGAVQLQADNQVFVAKLQRPEITAKKFEELLPDDR